MPPPPGKGRIVVGPNAVPAGNTAPAAINTSAAAAAAAVASAASASNAAAAVAAANQGWLLGSILSNILVAVDSF